MRISLVRLPEIIYRYKKSKELGCDYLAYINKPIYLIGANHINIGKNFASLPGVRIEAWEEFGGEKFNPIIKIGDNVTLNYRTHIGAICEVSIGNNVLMGSDVLVVDHNHGYNYTAEELDVPPRSRRLASRGGIIIEDNVWIGDKATILGNVHIGRGAVIGANSVVTRDVPEYSISAGVPARIIKSLK